MTDVLKGAVLQIDSSPDEVVIIVGDYESGQAHIKMGLVVDQKGYSVAYLEKQVISRDPVYFSTGLKDKDGKNITGSAYLDVDTLYIEIEKYKHKIRIQRVAKDVPHLTMHIDKFGV